MSTCFSWNLSPEDLDFFGKSNNLHLFGREKYKTKFGATMTLLSLIIIFSITLYFAINLLTRRDMSVIFNQDENMIPLVNMSNSPIMFNIADSMGNFIVTERLYNFDVNVIELVKNETNNSAFTISRQIEVEQCNRTKHIHKDYSKYFEKINTDNFYCLADTKNLSLYGKYGDYFNGFSDLSINVNRCENLTSNTNNNITNNNCYDNQTIEIKLTNVYFNFAFLSYQINNYNSTQSAQVKIQTTTNQISTTQMKRFRFHFNQIVYNTDYGFLFEDMQQENFYNYDSFEDDLDTKNSGVQSSTSNFVNFSFRCSDRVNYYYRSYIKLQTFIANFGGIFNAIMLIAEFIVNIITRKFYLLDIINSIFYFKNKNEIGNLNNNIKGNFAKKKIKPTPSINNRINIISRNKKSKNKFTFSNYNNLNKNTNFISSNIVINTNNTNNVLTKENYLNTINNSKLFSLEKFAPHINFNKDKTNKKFDDKLKMSFLQLILPKCCIFEKRKISKLENCKKFIKGNISIENIIERFYELNTLIKYALNDKQIKDFKSNKKLFFKNCSNNAQENNNLEKDDSSPKFLNIFKHFNSISPRIKEKENLI